jgi:hypothetical protein
MYNELYSQAPIGTLPLISDTGYMNTDLFVQWLHHFQNNVKATELDPVLLVLDKYIFHCSLEAVIFCRKNQIYLLSIPLHGSHKIQPLDFGPLKSAYSQECDAFIANLARQPITQRNLAGLFKRAYLRVATLDKAENSFRACRCYPFNPHIFSPEDFGPAQVSFVPNTAEKETNGSAAILQGDEASPKPSTSTNDAAPVNIPACGTSKEQSS